MLDDLRPPRRKELLEAWKKLMQSKLKRRVPLNSTQALQCRRLLEYLAEPSSPDEQAKALSAADLAMARQVLLDIEPLERGQNHLVLAKALHAVWSSGNFTGKARSPELQWAYLVKLLSRYGGSQEALQMLYSRWAEASYAAYLDKEDCLVEVVARGLAREGRERELVELVEYAQGHGVPYDSGLQAVMVCFFAARDRVPETWHWLDQPISQAYSQPEVYRSVASFAMRNGLQDWAMQLFLELGQSQPRKKHWDVLLQAIVLVGKTPGEVEAMMLHMVGRHGALSPDVNTLNGLLRVAVEMKDPNLAEEIFALGVAKMLAPNGETFLILLQMHIATGNVAGARAAYERAKHLEPWGNESKPALSGEYRQLLNQYLVLLSRRSPPDFKYILELLEFVDEGQILLEPETVSSLCLGFLENEHHFDVIDILSAHSFMFSEAQREVVQNAFIEFCLSSKTSTARAWGAYQLLQQFFQDTSTERRTRLMEAFFGRKRPDMASHVFGHMRQHRNKSYHPTMDTYVRCLEGFAQYPDAEGLGMVHNMLKMDTAMQPTTQLYTTLMLAHSACGKTSAALDVWKDITQSREGPSYASLEAVFWTLERTPSGDKDAREIWAKMERLDLEVTPVVYNAYVGAIAGSGCEKEIRDLIANMASVVGSEPDAMTLAVAHNALPGQNLQESFREWAQDKYPNAWAELNKAGRRVDARSLCQFKMKRVMRA